MKRVAQELARGTLSRDRLIEVAAAREPYFVPEGTPLTQQLAQFQRMRRRLAFVVNEYGDIAGLVTLEDILEEIVGEFTTDPAAVTHKDVQPGHRRATGSSTPAPPSAQLNRRWAGSCRQSDRARSTACCWRSSKPFRRRARHCASVTTISRSCRSRTMRSAPCACAWCPQRQPPTLRWWRPSERCGCRQRLGDARDADQRQSWQCGGNGAVARQVIPG